MEAKQINNKRYKQNSKGYNDLEKILQVGIRRLKLSQFDIFCDKLIKTVEAYQYVVKNFKVSKNGNSKRRKRLFESFDYIKTV